MKTLVNLTIAAATIMTVSVAHAEPTAEETYQDVQKTLGLVPGFLKAFPDQGVAAAWDELKSVQLNPKTALPTKTKELIGLAVAAQIPCRYCTYFHTQVAKLGGASDAELKEFLLSGITPDFDSADEAMAEVVRNTTSRLTPADLAALMAYLRALPPRPEEPRSPSGKS